MFDLINFWRRRGRYWYRKSVYEREERNGFRIKTLLSALVQRESCGGENCRSGRLRPFDPGDTQRKWDQIPMRLWCWQYVLNKNVIYDSLKYVRCATYISLAFVCVQIDLQCRDCNTHMHARLHTCMHACTLARMTFDLANIYSSIEINTPLKFQIIQYVCVHLFLCRVHFASSTSTSLM